MEALMTQQIGKLGFQSIGFFFGWTRHSGMHWKYLLHNINILGQGKRYHVMYVRLIYKYRQ